MDRLTLKQLIKQIIMQYYKFQVNNNNVEQIKTITNWQKINNSLQQLAKLYNVIIKYQNKKQLQVSGYNKGDPHKIYLDIKQIFKISNVKVIDYNISNNIITINIYPYNTNKSYTQIQSKIDKP